MNTQREVAYKLARELDIPGHSTRALWSDTISTYARTMGMPLNGPDASILIHDRSADTPDALLLCLIREAIAAGMEREDFTDWPTRNATTPGEPNVTLLLKWPSEYNPEWSGGVGPGVLIATPEGGEWLEAQYIPCLDYLNETVAPDGWAFEVDDNSLFLTRTEEI